MQHQLKAEHDELRKHMREFAGLLCAADPVDLPEIMRRRMAFSNLFRGHLAAEENEVRTLRGDASFPGYLIQREHGVRLQHLFLGYSTHVNDRPSSRIAQDWTGYRTSVLTLQRDCSQLMDWQEKTLHPLLHDDRPCVGLSLSAAVQPSHERGHSGIQAP